MRLWPVAAGAPQAKRQWCGSPGGEQLPLCCSSDTQCSLSCPLFPPAPHSDWMPCAWRGLLHSSTAPVHHLRLTGQTICTSTEQRLAHDLQPASAACLCKSTLPHRPRCVVCFGFCFCCILPHPPHPFTLPLPLPHIPLHPLLIELLHRGPHIDRDPCRREQAHSG